MRILILSQVFYPDNVAVSLFMTDLARELVRNNHQVTVWAGQYDWEDPAKKFPLREVHQGINIERLKNTALGKEKNLFRLVDFLSFNSLIFYRLYTMPTHSFDLVISTTVPPLLSFIVSLFHRSKKFTFFYWAMDLQPELSIQSGLIRKDAFSARILTWMGHRVFHQAHHIFALDQYMSNHIIKRGVSPSRISVSPLWPVMEQRFEGPRAENPFRQAHQWQDKWVIMYSGNHSLVHPISTLLHSALDLRNHPDLLFVFIGAGVRKKEVTGFKRLNQLKNIEQLPFQPRENVHISLSAADFQVVILGKNQVGFTHPNKIYGALYLGKPIIYIGPSPSHISDILDQCPGNISVNHGQVEKLTREILHFKNNPQLFQKVGQRNIKYAQKHLQPHLLKQQFIQQIETIYHSN